MTFSLSNEGHIHLYPLQPFKDKLEKAVKLRDISFQVSAKEAGNKTTAINMSAIETFDSVCRTTPSEASTTYFTSSQKITTYFTSSQKGTTYFTRNRQSTQPKETSSSSTPGEAQCNRICT